MRMDTLTVQQFWTSIWILIHNYHAVNRKIFACLVEEVYEIKNLLDTTGPPDDEQLDLEKSTEAELQNELTKESGNSKGFVLKQKFLTKKLEKDISAVCIIDFDAWSYTCKFIGCNLDDFLVLYNDNQLHMEALTQRNPSSERWLEYVLKPKLLKWALSAPSKPATKSLQLIDVEIYNNLYKELKCRHAEGLKKIWLEANESTDPLKFIYEDLAIAAYLICLWKSKNARRPVAFADLGCGNGLLVHVLNAEGYPGYGYDIRKRKIWSLYPASIQTRLIEAAVVPLEFSPPSEVDWLIGNHSDELSAWLPVLAALNRYETSYFLLPCCAFEFSGAKFQRRDGKVSTYQDFFRYANDISMRCGFQTLEDRLKIPSTKRLALVGCQRTYDPCDYDLKCTELLTFVDAEMLRYPHMGAQDAQIKLRDKEEIVRNCTKLDKDVLAALVDKIFKLLLTAPVSSEIFDADHWHPGGRLSMKEIVRSLTQQELQHIKSECGGIKTLLRNKHEVFEFLGNDLIGLRKPKKLDTPNTSKRRPCFFNENHPDGCPLNESDCKFLHNRLR